MDVINDAVLGVTYNSFGGSGSMSIGESFFNPNTGEGIGSLGLSNPPGTPVSATSTFAGLQSVLVKKDILLVGGTDGAGISILDQGFSSTTLTRGGGSVPEPAT